MAIISILTDFGGEDAYVGTMKAVVLGIAPDANLVDLCHGVSPQDVEEGAWLLGNSYFYFPKGTIHLAVVDPGVGTGRRALAMRSGDFLFVGPDNGIFSRVLEREGSFTAVHLTRSEYFLGHVSRTFQGRDLFAPVAAHLARGVALEDLGEPVGNPIRLSMQEPEESLGTLQLRIVRVDRFGNLITNLSQERFEQWIANNPNKEVALDVGRRRIKGIHGAYSEVPAGAALAIFGSSGRLEIAVNGGSAREILGYGKETPVMISFMDEMWGRSG